MKDSGYDVSDYRSVDPLFGTMDDFKTLLDKAHDLGLKVIIDQVLSHTSEEHPWFKESRRTRDNPKTDWYVWENPRRDGMPPTNWLARFGGPAWTYSIRRGQYYLHNFYANQPDLNLHNKDVQDTLLASMEMWLKIGVDGFRMDAVSFYMHDRRLRDNPFQPLPEENKIEGLHFVDPYTMQIHKYNQGAPEIFDFLKRIRHLMDQYPGTVTIGEASGASSEETMKLAARYTEGNKFLHTAYSHTLLGGGSLKESFIRKHVEGYENLPQDSWPSWAFSNHDVYRAVSRLNRGRAATRVLPNCSSPCCVPSKARLLSIRARNSACRKRIWNLKTCSITGRFSHGRNGRAAMARARLCPGEMNWEADSQRPTKKHGCLSRTNTGRSAPEIRI